MVAATRASTETVVRPVLKPTAVARNPIVGGPSRKPAYPRVDAAATPFGPATRPARVMAAGNMLATPSPVSAKPASTTGTDGASAAASIPAQAVSPPSTRTLVCPRRTSSQLPASRPQASASANAA
jgi:hypothetical protein